MTTQEIVQLHNTKMAAHYNRANVFATLLYGSQNYKLSTPESDVDTKSVILPTFHSLALNIKPVSTEHEAPDGALCSAKDVRLMFNSFLKSNINFLETLFTPYYVINPAFQTFWDKLHAARHLIANADPLRLMRATAGMAQQKYVAMERPFESKAEILAKYGYDPKQLVHLVRLFHFMEYYLESNSFGDSLVPQTPVLEYLVHLKANPLPLDKARLLKEYVKKRIDTLLVRAKNAYSPKPEISAKEFLDELVYSLLLAHATDEFQHKSF